MYLLEVTFSWTYSSLSDLEGISAYRMSVDEISWNGTVWKTEDTIKMNPSQVGGEDFNCPEVD